VALEPDTRCREALVCWQHVVPGELTRPEAALLIGEDEEDVVGRAPTLCCCGTARSGCCGARRYRSGLVPAAMVPAPMALSVSLRPRSAAESPMTPSSKDALLMVLPCCRPPDRQRY